MLPHPVFAVRAGAGNLEPWLDESPRLSRLFGVGQRRRYAPDPWWVKQEQWLAEYVERKWMA